MKVVYSICIFSIFERHYLQKLEPRLFSKIVQHESSHVDAVLTIVQKGQARTAASYLGSRPSISWPTYRMWHHCFFVALKDYHLEGLFPLLLCIRTEETRRQPSIFTEWILRSIRAHKHIAQASSDEHGRPAVRLCSEMRTNTTTTSHHRDISQWNTRQYAKMVVFLVPGTEVAHSVHDLWLKSKSLVSLTA